MSVELEEFEPGRWRVKRNVRLGKSRSDLPIPFVISDQMDPVEQVDGKFYTSKRAFRAVGRANGLIEIGTEKLKPKPKITTTKEFKEGRRQAIRRAIQKVQT